MGYTYLLKNLSHENVLECLGERRAKADPEGLEAYLALLRLAGSLLTSTDASLKRLGILQARLRLLVELSLSEKDGLAPRALADKLGVSRATITQLLDVLERDGFIERRPSKLDRRSLNVQVSPRGRALVAKVMPERLRRVEQFMSALTAGEKKQLTALLVRLESNLPAFSETER